MAEDTVVTDTMELVTDSIPKEHTAMTTPRSMEGCLLMARTRTTIVTTKGGMGTTGEICTIVTTIMEECQGEVMVMECTITMITTTPMGDLMAEEVTATTTMEGGAMGGMEEEVTTTMAADMEGEATEAMEEEEATTTMATEEDRTTTMEWEQELAGGV